MAQYLLLMALAVKAEMSSFGLVCTTVFFHFPNRLLAKAWHGGKHLIFTQSQIVMTEVPPGRLIAMTGKFD